MATTIQLSNETKRALESRKVGGDSYDQVIRKNLGLPLVGAEVSNDNSHVITLPRTYEQVPSGEEVYIDEHIPITGTIITILMLFPPGTSSKVGVQTLYYPPTGSKEHLVPSIENAWVSLDSHVAVYDNLNFRVKSGGKIRVKLKNEGDHPHYVQVDILISTII
ncbi:MAG: hypothetical protein A7315_05900 [Candidatus Altiarchaeales archaeon WOR_SM1_79]|nr:MAG: hypothetical protein A7315_05900 [Candidatus Altiarchaeales archaeon WOR_SM1_79]